jgi:hypothetical protein
MAWTTEDRRRYAPAIQEMARRGVLVGLAATIDAIHPPSAVGRPRIWPTLVVLQALRHVAGDDRAWRRLPPRRPPHQTAWSRLRSWRGRAGGAGAGAGRPGGLPPPRGGPQAPADGHDHRRPERQDRPPAWAARLRPPQAPRLRRRGRASRDVSLLLGAASCAASAAAAVCSRSSRPSWSWSGSRRSERRPNCPRCSCRIKSRSFSISACAASRSSRTRSHSVRTASRSARTALCSACNDASEAFC